jgi:hypothetical protein
MTRVYESNGPDVKIRGTAHHIAEKYAQLARDALSSGDPIGAESYLQHAEHYYRMIMAAQAQFAQQNPHHQQQPYQRPDMDGRDDFDDEGDSEGGEQQPQPNGQSFQGAHNQQQMHRPQPQYQSQPNMQQPYQRRDEVQPDGSLPAFITGSGGQPQQMNGGEGEQGERHDRGDRGDRFGRRRRRFRPRGPGGEQEQRGEGASDIGGDFAKQGD